MKTTRKPTTAVRAPKRRVAVGMGHSRQLISIARLLEVRPEAFLSWILDDILGDFLSPKHGILKEYADDHILYETPEQAARVKTNVSRFLRAKAKRQVAKGGKEGPQS